MSSPEREKKTITRREFVKGAAVGAAAAGAGALAGCAIPAPQVVTEKVEVPVEVTRIVEKVVEVEKIVEVPASGEAGPARIEVLDPTGSIEVTQLHAPRLDTLEGKTICELAMEWQAWRTFPYFREILQNMYPTAKFVGWEDMPRIGGLDEEGTELIPVLEAVAAAECDAVFVGNAG